MRGTKRRDEEVQPQLQRDIVNDYRRGVRGHGYLTIAKKHQLPIHDSSIGDRAGRVGRWGSSRAAWSQEEAGQR